MIFFSMREFGTCHFVLRPVLHLQSFFISSSIVTADFIHVFNSATVLDIASDVIYTMVLFPKDQHQRFFLHLCLGVSTLSKHNQQSTFRQGRDIVSMLIQR